MPRRPGAEAARANPAESNPGGGGDNADRIAELRAGIEAYQDELNKLQKQKKKTPDERAQFQSLKEGLAEFKTKLNDLTSGQRFEQEVSEAKVTAHAKKEGAEPGTAEPLIEIPNKEEAVVASEMKAPESAPLGTEASPPDENAQPYAEYKVEQPSELLTPEQLAEIGPTGPTELGETAAKAARKSASHRLDARATKQQQRANEERARLEKAGRKAKEAAEQQEEKTTQEGARRAFEEGYVAPKKQTRAARLRGKAAQSEERADYLEKAEELAPGLAEDAARAAEARAEELREGKKAFEAEMAPKKAAAEEDWEAALAKAKEKNAENAEQAYLDKLQIEAEEAGKENVELDIKDTERLTKLLNEHDAATRNPDTVDVDDAREIEVALLDDFGERANDAAFPQDVRKRLERKLEEIKARRGQETKEKREPGKKLEVGETPIERSFLKEGEKGKFGAEAVETYFEEGRKPEEIQSEIQLDLVPEELKELATEREKAATTLEQIEEDIQEIVGKEALSWTARLAYKIGGGERRKLEKEYAESLAEWVGLDNQLLAASEKTKDEKFRDILRRHSERFREKREKFRASLKGPRSLPGTFGPR